MIVSRENHLEDPDSVIPVRDMFFALAAALHGFTASLQQMIPRSRMSVSDVLRFHEARSDPDSRT